MKYINYLLVLFFFFSFLLRESNAQTPAELKSWLPNIEGWSISEKIEIFDAENLFDRINGSAPLFIENNFKEMTSLEYTKGDDYITIQAYRHGRPEDAFGMYASERSSGLEHFDIGGEAQGDDTGIYFFAGNMYVKIWGTSSADIKNVLHNIASGLANRIDPDAKYPEVTEAFPVKGKIPDTDSFITSNYIGHEFLKNVYTANYKLDNQSFQAFVIDAGDMEGAKSILTKYLTFTKQPIDMQEGYLTIKDRYNGEIPLYWKGRYIMGVFMEDGNSIESVTDFFEELSKKL